jgi:hypothetical protein
MHPCARRREGLGVLVLLTTVVLGGIVLHAQSDAPFQTGSPLQTDPKSPPAATPRTFPTDDIKRISVSLTAWLAASGLGDSLNMEKLRWVDRPASTDNDHGARWLELDLRFVTKGT